MKNQLSWALLKQIPETEKMCLEMDARKLDGETGSHGVIRAVLLIRLRPPMIKII